ncbi:hypothetical protein MTX78_15140 [Hymenobacter tibetensis]|uniref:Gliding motility-associated protein GldM C-terminal domain-containing protein n=1 Tax=Hymenobacter tibetensis TaxID=497967 RepID=A0ABY4CT81_9BACT|nr:hypothetical protein [Hymenobacter tibetensis]UOG73459.1 hypothetical protein MTX78_15140 [Hymenobacter tibetensis]
MKKLISKIRILLFLMLFILINHEKARSQDFLTGAAILTASSKVTTALGNLSPQLGYAGASVASGAITQLGQLTNDLKALLGQNVNAPITSMSFEIQNLARQVTTAITQLDAVLDKQRNCGIKDIENLISTVSTVALQLKEGVPLIDAAKPRFNYFSFDGHTPGTVPKEGGQATLIGFKLWPEPTVRPVVELLNETRTAVLGTLTAARGSSNDEISVRIPKAILTRHAGQCLYIRVMPKEIRGSLFWKEVVTINEVTRAMCIPSARVTSLQIRAAIEYSCPSVSRTTLPAEGFYFENNDPVLERQVSETRGISVPEGCRIISLTPTQQNITRHFRNASFAFTDKSITANAHLGDAEDFNPPIGPRVVTSHAVWSYSVVPNIECNSNTPVSDPLVESSFVPMGESITRLSVTLPKNCNIPTSNVRFEVWKKHGNEKPTKIHETAWIPAGQAGVTNTANSDYAKLAISLQYNPGVLGGTAQVFITVTAPNCGY